MKVLIAALLLVASLGPLAAADPEQPRQERPRVSEQWLSIQRDGVQASRQVQSATAAERELANQRWLDSYRHAIPERYYDDDGASGSASSGE
ncbi:DUF3613 domain-containing protein [Metapseudomonas furukawaii]